ncbi:MAG: nucleotide pyrophosphohydrolase [Candidatus Wallbacteria bacterium HGW-Wallbacteria-1]|jgi:NTP pyrophosphatase (non-canonical NTP hydrolase)|uniref:Nucleotide pyrophosphohydrolase n=1 Tax=Candidatus Wallbacteria bacterium HGW-Wallbacteria-1 TaxID=2013854 RepID=A0A2N1PKA5_9BACT|nr:MAG: nucleotide pyrophosphohydrolase [Candidatus Wallbacteria bacterium HGW-Wallbacteria-1]
MYSDDRLGRIQRTLHEFVAERDWRQFHSPKNLSMSIAIEAAELMEIFQWETVEESWKIADDEARFNHLKEELSDILAYSIGLANILNLDIEEIMMEKIEKNRKKYPTEQFQGRY